MKKVFTEVNVPSLCGKDHGFMPVVVEAKSEADFKAWLADAKQAKQKAALADAAST